MAQLQVDHKCARETVLASSRNQQPQKELRFKAFGKLSHLWFVCCNCYTLWLLWALKMKQRNKETNRYIEKHQKISKNKVFCNHVLRIFLLTGTKWDQMQCDSSRGIISEYCMGGLVPSLICLCSLIRMIHLVVLRPCDKQISRNMQSPSHVDACCAKPCVLTRLDSPWILIFPSFGEFFYHQTRHQPTVSQIGGG